MGTKLKQTIMYVYENGYEILEAAGIIFVSSLLVAWVLPLVFGTNLVQTLLQLNPSHFSTTQRIFSFYLPIIFGITTYPFARNLLLRYVHSWKIPANILNKIIFGTVLTLMFLLRDETAISNFQITSELSGFVCDGIIKYFITLVFLGGVEKFGSGLRQLIGLGSSPASSPIYFLDEPIKDNKLDLLDRAEFIKGITKQIIEMPSKSPFVFGLYGEWGEGKTSILNLLEKELRKSKKVIVIRFNPWLFETQEALLQSFFDDLEKGVNRFYLLPGFKRMIYKYQRLIFTPIKSFWLDFGELFEDESLVETKERLNKITARLDRKLVVMIDDIDRLASEKMLQILKLVNLSGSLKNMLFVLSFDPEVVNQALEEEFNIDRQFLEKIIQKGIFLPQPEREHLDKFLDQGLEGLFEATGVEKQKQDKFSKDIQYLYASHLKGLLPNLRSIKRLLNNLRATLPPLKDEVNLKDIFLLEFMRTFYPEVFKDIWKNRWYYCNTEWDMEMNLESPFGYGLRGEGAVKAREVYHKGLLKNKPRKEALEEILVELFLPVKVAFREPRTSYDYVSIQYLKEQRVTHPAVFRKYFMEKVPAGEIPDTEIKKTIDLINSADKKGFATIFNELIQEFRKVKQLPKFFDKLNLFSDAIAKDKIPLLIRYIYHNAPRLSRGRKGEDRFRAEFTRGWVLVLSLLNERTDKRKIQGLMEKIIEKTPSHRFALQIVIGADKKEKGEFHTIYENIDLAKLKEIASKRFERAFIVPKRDIFEEGPRDAQLIIRRWGEQNEEDRKKVSGYIFGLISKTPNYLGRIVDGYILHWERGDWQIEYDPLVELYGESEILKRIKKLGKSAYSNEQEERAIGLFLKVYNQRKSEKQPALQK